MKKRFQCFRNKKYSPKKKRGSASNKKRGFSVSEIRNMPLKKKRGSTSEEKEALAFQK
jgi:hypothetical protein